MRTTIRPFCARLCYRAMMFVIAFPNERLEALLEGHIEAFKFFYDVHCRILSLICAPSSLMVGTNMPVKNKKILFALRLTFHSNPHYKAYQEWGRDRPYEPRQPAFARCQILQVTEISLRDEINLSLPWVSGKAIFLGGKTLEDL